MGKGNYLGEFEQVVLLALLQLGDEAYGMTIRRAIEEQTERHVAIGAIYATLERLERKALVRSELMDPTPVRGGRAKRFYRLVPKGADALRRSREMLTKMWEVVESHPDLRAS